MIRAMEGRGGSATGREVTSGRAVGELQRTVLLGLVLVVALGSAWGWFTMVPLGCLGGAPGAPTPPWYVARPDSIVVPTAVFLLGAFVGLGARRIAWRLVGTALSIVGAAAAFILVVLLMQVC